MADQIIDYLSDYDCTHYHEVFVGGGSILCGLLKSVKKPKFVYVNDLDEYIHSFWEILKADKQEIDIFFQLLRQEPTMELFKKLREKEPNCLAERAYYAVFFNRTTFSGIYKSGPIGGHGQKSKWSIGCRYNCERIIAEFTALKKRLEDIDFNVYKMSALDYLKQDRGDGHIYYIDPPYFVKGKSLYNVFMSEEQHEQLSVLLKKRQNWVLSYDACKKIDDLYDWAVKIPINVGYSINGEKKGWNRTQEYIILPPNGKSKKIEDITF